MIWGGDNHCEHKWDSYDATLLHENRQGLGSFDVTPKIGIHGKRVGQASFCSICGAWKGAFGLEPTPEMYIDHSIEILREIKRVLRKDGVVFWNIGDSYFGSQGGSHDYRQDKSLQKDIYNWDKPQSKHWGKWRHDAPNTVQVNRAIPVSDTLKPKDLCLIPFRLAIACQEDGWWIRSVIIWSKLNPMPESVTDRPTESHDYILMLTKSARYYWDADAVRSPLAEATVKRAKSPFYPDHWKAQLYRQTQGIERDAQTFNRDVYSRIASGEKTIHNIRTVWEFPTQPSPFRGVHFAVFPEKLPEICIKAATSEKGCCPKCGAPWVRVIKVIGSNYPARKAKGVGGPYNLKPELLREAAKLGNLGSQSETLGWRPACNCGNLKPTPCLVLDPFAGTGTTLWVAKKLGRRAVGYDISEAYCKLALERNRQMALELMP